MYFRRRGVYVSIATYATAELWRLARLLRRLFSIREPVPILWKGDMKIVCVNSEEWFVGRGDD